MQCIKSNKAKRQEDYSMEGKVMTFEELAKYAEAARSEYEQRNAEKQKEEDIRSVIKVIIDNVKEYGAVQVKYHKGVIYLRDPKSEDDRRIKESKDITLADIKTAIDRIPALYAEQPTEGRNPLYVTFRRSNADSK